MPFSDFYALQDAAGAGNFARVKKQLKRYPQLLTFSDSYNPAMLDKCAQVKLFEGMQYMLDRKAQITAYTLHCACNVLDGKTVETLKFLFDRVDAKDRIAMATQPINKSGRVRSLFEEVMRPGRTAEEVDAGCDVLRYLMDDLHANFDLAFDGGATLKIRPSISYIAMLYHHADYSISQPYHKWASLLIEHKAAVSLDKYLAECAADKDMYGHHVRTINADFIRVSVCLMFLVVSVCWFVIFVSVCDRALRSFVCSLA